ncbi:hypothetical protein KC363_g3244 [Hortaea werneckii]|uniref:Uncharacterized protein n=1 Tax=Hortaea werneckii TaxID=91943 RepID=A0A3M7FY86_HORWE|nr:hypothetical protein KC361_g1423 [Hortaea werneckii]KAI6888665.1 hypothetical protein KC325_g1110 [Hortaea werneckii]KAI7001606.1 hypothetical protein KC359_g448 [Hortaea werneckii]KAI7150039.1 hypothetical protein KC344_g434 [Hortaea werneckii]KAI7177064.1 hypothetical protein KC360_g2634 [Hortaea werneckii]
MTSASPNNRDDGRPENETAASTPTSSHHADGSSQNLRSAKDRSCPFCGQAFTSSSLGRHLDLYIKPRNPKPADGVHDVEEIKKLRGGITRRQPKANLKPGANINASGWGKNGSEAGTPDPEPSGSGSGGGGSGGGSAGKTHSSGPSLHPRHGLAARVTDASPEYEPPSNPMKEHQGPVQTSFNAPNWQATGVINDLPPRRPSSNPSQRHSEQSGQVQRIQQMRKDNAGNRMQRPETEDMSTMKLQEAAEVGRAAELALREIMGSLEAAKAKTEPKQLFEDVDFFSLSFPGLCLALLPAPPTLFSSTPFSGPNTWTLKPPGHAQMESLSNALVHRIATVRNYNVNNWLDSDVFRHNAHLQSAFEHWSQLSESQRQEAWTLETLRCMSRANEAKEHKKTELEAAQNRIRHLEAEYDRLSRCQLPREYLLHPPNTVPTPAALMKEMQHASSHLYAQAAADVDYDADALLNKWRTAVKATQRRSAAQTAPASGGKSTHCGAAAKADARTDIINYERHETDPSSEQMKGDMIMQGAIFGVGGPMSRPKPGANLHDSPAGDHSTVGWDYETPPNPGVVVDEMVDGEEDAAGDADEDAEGEADEDAAKHGNRALVRHTRSGIRNEKVNGVTGLNGNGKRPLGTTGTDGRAGGPKVLRERWK